ncbi:hypothetical protein Misp06_03668 [Microbulbifer sp. NBRC 101763]|uniref:hypothetical protein n=1 Tax=Microbulbifer sp. NBRC 101763 TaxID=1113820 RepID=UPI0030A0473B
MSGRKNKHKQRGQQRKQPSELLSELSSLHDLLNSDDLDEIPLLNQVAGPHGQGTPQQTPEPRSQVEVPTLTAEPPSDLPSSTDSMSQQQPAPTIEEDALDTADLPILFSPVEEVAPSECEMQLAESDLALLRPLQELPPTETETEVTDPEATGRGITETAKQAQVESSPAQENPFLPAHIRARLTGGKVPTGVDQDAQSPEPVDPTSAGTRTQALAMAQAITEEGEPADQLEPTEKERQRQALIEQLVAQQLPQLERRLRAQIEKVVDELGVWD